jgi:signal transduction histidine kinase/ligand-binding sensor domain-containing protein/DNA-binding response OmpR family regulator
MLFCNIKGSRNLTMIKRLLVKNFLLPIVIIVAFYSICYAQQDLNFTSLTIKNGLSSNTVSAILQDRKGLVWFGTNDGLNKFDGTNFTVYNHIQSDSTSIPSSEITAMLEDRSGRLWVGTGGGGVAFYDARHDTFVSLKDVVAKGQNVPVNVKALYQDGIGNILVGGFGGYVIIDPKTMTTITVPVSPLPNNTLNSLAVLSFFEDQAHRLWIGTNNGLLLQDKKTQTFTRFIHQPSIENSISDNRIRTINQDNRGRIFFGTNNGFNMLMPDGKTFRRFLHSDQASSSISNNIIYSVKSVSKDNLWLATEDGVIVFDLNTLTFSSIRPSLRHSLSLISGSVRSICIAQRGIIWLGTFRGGISKLDPNLALFNLKRSNPFDPRGLKSPIVTSFVEYSKNSIFVGSDRGGLQLFNRNSELFDPIEIKSKIDNSGNPLAILALELDSKKKIWIGTYQNGLFVYDPKSGQYKQYLSGPTPYNLSQNDIFFVKEDSKGLIWVGTNGSGVDVLDPKTQMFTRFGSTDPNMGKANLPTNGFMRTMAESKTGEIWLGSDGSGIAVFNPVTKSFSLYNKLNSGLSNNAVLSIFHDRYGITWVGTNGGGLNIFNARTNRFSVLKETNERIYKILEDKNGLIWISTDKGISSIDPKTRIVKNFSRPNGVQDSPFVMGAGLVTSDNQVFFGGQDGFNYFFPTKLPVNNIIPQVLLTDLKVENNTVSPGKNAPIQDQISFAKEIRLPYGQKFSISYVALNYTAPQQNHYSYKLVGLDKDWNNVGKEKTAYYTNLDPGKYVFQVRASNNDGVWSNKITTITIHILPPFWRTIYAYVFYILLLAGLLFYSRRRGIRKIENKLALQQEKINAQRLIEQHQREAERVHALDEQKIKFLTNLSHEFRTPISLILAPADKLLALEKTGGNSGEVRMIKRNARRLLNLVNQLLDFRKMEEQELRLNLQQGDLAGFIREAAESFKDLSERKKISLYIEDNNVESVYTVFDHDKVERIIFNLLSNAFKFTEGGGEICLKMDLIVKSDDPMAVFSLAVSDNGIGINPQIKEKVFDRFFMDNNSLSILNQGSGIGLSITKEFIQLHGGEITVESEQGKGATFNILLPVNIIKPEQHKELAVPENQKPEMEINGSLEKIETEGVDLKMPTILLVEDNEEFRYHLKDSLQPYYHIIEAANGKEGWQKALSCHPQLVVSDINMPFMSGIELSQKIKSDKRTNHIPVILLTAIGGEEDQIKGLESGVNDYLTKPFNFEILNAKIRNLLLYNRSIKDVYSKHVQVKSEEIEIESSEVKLLNRIVKYIDEKLNHPDLSVEELSKHVGMSRGSLYHKLLEITGLTPIEYIRSVKLDRAVELLEKSDYNVAQIAYMTGFGTPSYFSKLFKARYGSLPSEYISLKRKRQDQKPFLSKLTDI